MHIKSNYMYLRSFSTFSKLAYNLVFAFALLNEALCSCVLAYLLLYIHSNIFLVC